MRIRKADRRRCRRGVEAILTSTPHPTHLIRIEVTPMRSRGRCCAMNETAATKCRVFAFSKRTCAAKTVSMSLYCLKYGAWIQVCTGHGRSLLSSEQQFSKRVIIKAELRPKAGSSIFLSITVTPVCFDNKVFD